MQCKSFTRSITAIQSQTFDVRPESEPYILYFCICTSASCWFPEALSPLNMAGTCPETFVQMFKLSLEQWSLAWQPSHHHSFHHSTWKSAHIHVKHIVEMSVWHHDKYTFIYTYTSVVLRNVVCQHFIPAIGYQGVKFTVTVNCHQDSPGTRTSRVFSLSGCSTSITQTSPHTSSAQC